LQTALV